MNKVLHVSYLKICFRASRSNPTRTSCSVLSLTSASVALLSATTGIQFCSPSCLSMAFGCSQSIEAKLKGQRLSTSEDIKKTVPQALRGSSREELQMSFEQLCRRAVWLFLVCLRIPSGPGTYLAW